MKIINFSVNNYKRISGGLEQNKIDFDGSNTIFIFGQNNSGKSTFLNAYILYYEDSKVQIVDFLNKNENNTIEIVIEVELNDEEKKQLKDKQDNADKKYFYGEKNNRLTLKKEWMKANSPSNNFTLLKDKSGFDDIGYAGIGEHKVFKNMLPKPILIEAMPTAKGLEEKVNEILSIRIKEMSKQKEHEAYLAAEKAIKDYQKIIYGTEEINKYRDEVNKRFSTMFPELSLRFIENEDIDIISKAITRSFTLGFDHLDNDKNPHKDIPNQFEYIGHGAIRIALFNLFLLEDIAIKKAKDSEGKNYLVLFEEPELFLHPKLTKQLRDLIYQVSEEKTPFQVVCASHSPQMIDLTKPKTSIVRMVKSKTDTRLYQIDESVLTDNKFKVKEEIYVALRFNPFICESFYADEVILIEGDSEAVLLRGYLQLHPPKNKDLFVVNCGTVTNIPFFQKIFAKFNITYHVIFDCDNHCINCGSIINFKSGIQKTIKSQYDNDQKVANYIPGKLYTHHPSLESAHHKEPIPKELQYPDECFNDDGKFTGISKPVLANEYWKLILEPNLSHKNIDTVPIISALKNIIEE